MTRLVALFVLLLLADALPAQAPKPVLIDAATARRLAIATAPARSFTSAPAATGFARVLDPLPLAQLDADIAAAAPAAAASGAEAARSRALFAADVTVSRKVAEAAATQARGDAARLALLRRRLGLEWGPAIIGMSASERGALIGALAAGRAALVRIDTSGGVGQTGLHSATLDLGSLGTVSATILGPARVADPRLQSPGLIARVTGAKAALLTTGLALPATLGAAARPGVLVPAAAVLRLGGATWIYVRIAPGRFERRRIDGTRPVAGGLFAAHGVQPGEQIVVAGAAALYAAERGGGPPEG